MEKGETIDNPSDVCQKCGKKLEVVKELKDDLYLVRCGSCGEEYHWKKDDDDVHVREKKEDNWGLWSTEDEEWWNGVNDKGELSKFEQWFYGKQEK